MGPRAMLRTYLLSYHCYTSTLSVPAGQDLSTLQQPLPAQGAFGFFRPAYAI